MSVQRSSVEMVADVLVSLLTTTVTVLVGMKANSVMLVRQQFHFTNLSTHSCGFHSKKSMSVFPTLASMEFVHIKSISTTVIVLLDTLAQPVRSTLMTVPPVLVRAMQHAMME